ncbi:MAG: O-antigen ligase family protein, partial [Burkholderiales bacterium]|nr:O-antigen ligase family protein [Burkholderiales bacterium]
MSAVVNPLQVRYRHAGSSADRLAKWSAVALGFSIPISTALDNLLLGLILLGWVASGHYRDKLRAIRDNPIALLALALFALLSLGTLHGVAPISERLDFLGKYKDLLFIALLISLFRDETAWRHALLGFAAAMLLTLLLSFTIGFGILPDRIFAHGAVSNPVVFKLHITQNLLMAYAAFLFATAALRAAAGARRTWLALASVLAIYNVLFLVHGRTGHVVISVLTIFFFASWLRWRGFVIGVLAVALLSVAAFYESPAFRERVLKANDEYQLWYSGAAIAEDNSVGSRMQWYRAGIAIIGEHPLIGVGTGSFAGVYA